MTLLRRTLSLVLAVWLCLGSSGELLWAQRASSSKTSKKTHKTKKKRRVLTSEAARKKAIRLQKLSQEFQASSELRPMAKQLLETRSAEAYRGVEQFAIKHADDDAGALAWLDIGYAHILDNEFDKAIVPLTRAQAHQDEIGDYTAYFLAQAYRGAGANKEVISTLADYDDKYPGAIFGTEAALLYAGALTAEGNYKDAIAALVRHRTPLRSNVELAIGRAQIAGGQTTAGAVTLQRIYYEMPTTGEAAAAKDDLDALARKAKLPTPSYAQRRTRADVLAKFKKYRDAADEYRELMTAAPTSELRGIEVELGASLYHVNSFKDARKVLEQVAAGNDELDNEKLYLLAEIDRNTDQKAYLNDLQKLRQLGNGSPWFQEELLSTANWQLLKRNYVEAARFYGELASVAPKGQYAAYAHWKQAWLTFRLKDYATAKKLFEEQVDQWPGSDQVPPAMYWRGRLAEEDKDPSTAAAYYQKLTQRFPLYYYSLLAQERLAGLKVTDPPALPVLAKIPARAPYRPGMIATPPADNIRVKKAAVLENAAMFEFAARELEAAGKESEDTAWVAGAIARAYQDGGQSFRALQVLKRAMPNYASFQIGELPRPLWETLFPRDFWPYVTKYSQDNKLDPYLTAALIRQESEFNPLAISYADAWGLMQLLPGNGKQLAKKFKVKGYSTSQLLAPETNIQFGTYFFSKEIEHYDGQVEYALAAYNAGEDRVSDWRSSNDYRDIHEFVENIPFTQTREYVQAIMRNVAIYHQLYDTKR